ncbi:hypothetical protein F4677DRAFT_456992 [Hypoxylon crocopeplum]|nr:hypothetical protein F4677DRAFT_456992 [Hypoxylon crocopeplum]
MRGRVSKPQAYRIHLKLSKISQEKRLDAIVSRIPELLSGRGSRSLMDKGLAKRQFDAAFTNDPSPKKRARLTQTDIHKRPPRRSRAGARGDSLPWKRARPRTNTHQSEVPNKEVAEKRQIESDSDDDHQLERPQLTRENLAKLNNKMPKKGTSKASASIPPSTIVSITTKTTSTTMSGFIIHACKNDILDPSEYKRYINRIGLAPNEAIMIVKFRPFPVNKYISGAVTIFIINDINLNLFIYYIAPSEDGILEYYQYPIKSTSLINSHQGLKDGRRRLRNEQDYARNQSYAMRDQLKERWKQQSVALHPISEGGLLPVVDSTFGEKNEDENGYVAVEQPRQPTPAASSSVSSSKSALPADDYVSCSSGYKRKASLLQRSSRGSSKLKSKA